MAYAPTRRNEYLAAAGNRAGPAYARGNDFAEFGGTWPPHCVRDTWGAELHAALDVADARHGEHAIRNHHVRHRQHAASDVGRLVGGKPEDRIGDLARIRPPTGQAAAVSAPRVGAPAAPGLGDAPSGASSVSR